MKSKKGAFVNSATGYGKNKHHSHHSFKNSQKTPKSIDNSVNKNIKNDQEPAKPKLDDLDTELNSGFGNYLRSGEGVEMMKMFVFANTVMMIITMAWPQIKEQYYWLREWLESFSY